MDEPSDAPPIDFPRTPSTIEIRQVESLILNDDDDEHEDIQDTDGQSTTDTMIASKEIEAILNDNPPSLTCMHLPTFPGANGEQQL